MSNLQDNNIENISKQLVDLVNSAQLLQLALDSLKVDMISKKRNYLTSEEAAQYLSISINTLRAYSSQKRIPYYKSGKLSYFLIEDLDNFIINSNNRIKPISESRSEVVTKLFLQKNQTKNSIKKN